MDDDLRMGFLNESQAGRQVPVAITAGGGGFWRFKGILQADVGPGKGLYTTAALTMQMYGRVTMWTGHVCAQACRLTAVRKRHKDNLLQMHQVHSLTCRMSPAESHSQNPFMDKVRGIVPFTKGSGINTGLWWLITVLWASLLISVIISLLGRRTRLTGHSGEEIKRNEVSSSHKSPFIYCCLCMLFPPLINLSSHWLHMNAVSHRSIMTTLHESKNMFFFLKAGVEAEISLFIQKPRGRVSSQGKSSFYSFYVHTVLIRPLCLSWIKQTIV